MVPVRPFQAPPKIIDVTHDCQYEKEWIPIYPIKDKRSKKMDADELADLHKQAKWNREYVDRVLFEGFLDQGDTIKEMEPQELNDFAGFWKREKELRDKARKEIEKFEKLDPTPHDIKKIQPMSYNLSIQYDQEKKKEDDKAAKAKNKERKRKELMERQGQGVGNQKDTKAIPEASDEEDGPAKAPKEAGAPPESKIVIGQAKQAKAVSMGNNQKMMNQAIEQIVEETDGSRTMPNLSRGPEIEITSRQDVERLKALLSQNKIHGITTKTLERAIVMPRDNDAFHPGYLPIVDQLMHNPYRAPKESKAKGGRKRKDEDGAGRVMRGPDGRMKNAPDYGDFLVPNEAMEYKVYEYGNFPYRKRGGGANENENKDDKVPPNF